MANKLPKAKNYIDFSFMTTSKMSAVCFPISHFLIPISHSLVPTFRVTPCSVAAVEKWPGNAHARTIPEIFCELVRLWTSYTQWRWLPLSERQEVTQGLPTTTASSTITVLLVVETNGRFVAD